MPEAVLVEGIKAAGVLGAAGIGSTASSRAARAQAKAGQSALKSQSETEGLDRKESNRRYHQRWEDYQARLRAWEARNTPQPRGRWGHTQVGGVPRQSTPGTAPPQGAMPQAPGATRTRTIGDLMGVGGIEETIAPLVPTGATRPRTLSDLSKWSDWSQYGA